MDFYVQITLTKHVIFRFHSLLILCNYEMNAIIPTAVTWTIQLSKSRLELFQTDHQPQVAATAAPGVWSPPTWSRSGSWVTQQAADPS